MELIKKKLSDKKAAKQKDAAATYWSSLGSLARGGLSPEEQEAMIEALAEAADALGRDPETVEADEERLREHVTLGDTAAGNAAAEEQAHEHNHKARALDAKVVELAAECDRVRQQAEAEKGRATAIRRAAREASKRAAQLRRELAASGHPDFAAEIENDRREYEKQQLRRQLNATNTDLDAIQSMHGRDTSQYSDGVIRVFGKSDQKRRDILAKIEAEVTP